MDPITLVGLAAGAMTTISFFPQALKVYKTRHTKDLSLGMFAISTVGISTWLIYGILQKDIPLIAANSITVTMVVYITIMKIKLG